MFDKLGVAPVRCFDSLSPTNLVIFFFFTHSELEQWQETLTDLLLFYKISVFVTWLCCYLNGISLETKIFFTTKDDDSGLMAKDSRSSLRKALFLYIESLSRNSKDV